MKIMKEIFLFVTKNEAYKEHLIKTNGGWPSFDQKFLLKGSWKWNYWVKKLISGYLYRWDVSLFFTVILSFVSGFLYAFLIFSL
jgi:hypothetical protein